MHLETIFACIQFRFFDDPNNFFKLSHFSEACHHFKKMQKHIFSSRIRCHAFDIDLRIAIIAFIFLRSDELQIGPLTLQITSLNPSLAPSVAPTQPPSIAPTLAPSLAPSVAPSMAPSIAPS
ncbi:MAG: hypothetical protein GY928_25520 [Colwellia sp.]|nr:hypothetical protein [Colwellia sp.]